jgi:hypothetical protein
LPAEQPGVGQGHERANSGMIQSCR